MDTRPLGATGHESSIATFGAIALNYLEQEGANQLVELALDRGVNHFDVAPTYGDAELKLGPKLRQHREEIFLGCKTQKRSYDGAKRKLDRSLDRLGVDTIDLYQLHGLEATEELDTLTSGDSALDAIREAREEGTIEHLGLTSHGDPDLILDAMDRIDDLETVMFPFNPVVAGTDNGGPSYEAVLERAKEEDVGTLIIKPSRPARGPPPTNFPRPTGPTPTGTNPSTGPRRSATASTSPPRRA